MWTQPNVYTFDLILYIPSNQVELAIVTKVTKMKEINIKGEQCIMEKLVAYKGNRS